MNVYNITECMYKGYWVIWCWIRNLFHEWDRNFYIFHECKAQVVIPDNKKILSLKWNKIPYSMSNHWIFCLLHFLWFYNMFLQNLDTACNNLHDDTMACYFHTVNFIFTVWKYPACEDNCVYFMDKTQYLMAEKVILVKKVTVLHHLIVMNHTL